MFCIGSGGPEEGTIQRCPFLLRRDNEVNDAKKNKGKEWYDDHKNQNIQITGRTYIDRNSGRLVLEIFSEGPRRARTLAEEIYHGGFEIIREAAPRSFAEIQRWYATRPERTGQLMDLK